MGVGTQITRKTQRPSKELWRWDEILQKKRRPANILTDLGEETSKKKTQGATSDVFVHASGYSCCGVFCVYDVDLVPHVVYSFAFHVSFLLILELISTSTSNQCLVKPLSNFSLAFLYTPWALSQIFPPLRFYLLLTAFSLPILFLLVSSLFYFFMLLSSYLYTLLLPWSLLRLKCFPALYIGLSTLRSNISCSYFLNKTSFLCRPATLTSFQ